MSLASGGEAFVSFPLSPPESTSDLQFFVGLGDRWLVTGSASSLVAPEKAHR